MGMELLAALVPLVAVVMVVLAVGRRSRRLTVGPRRGFVLGLLGAGLVLAVVVFVGGAGVAGWHGLPQMLAPGLGALVVLVGIAVAPLSRRAVAGGEAELRVRGVASLGPAWFYAVPATAAALMLLTVVFFGVSSSPDESGQYRVIAIAAGILEASAGPYPGWFYGVPAVVMALALLTATVVALARVARQPLRGSTAEREQERGWRHGLAGVVMAVATGSLLVYTGGMAAFAGIATGSVVSGIAWTSDHGHLGWDLPVVSALGATELGLGFAAVVLGLSLCITACVLAARR